MMAPGWRYFVECLRSRMARNCPHVVHKAGEYIGTQFISRVYLTLPPSYLVQ